MKRRGRHELQGRQGARAGFVHITAVPPTRGDLSFLIVQITDAGRRALAAAEQ
jgi:hypothetical protein